MAGSKEWQLERQRFAPAKVLEEYRTEAQRDTGICKAGLQFCSGNSKSPFILLLGSHVHNESHLSGNAQARSRFCLSIFLYPQWVFFLMEEIFLLFLLKGYGFFI